MLVKICGKINPADILTKPKSLAEMVRLTDALWYDIQLRRQRPGDQARDGGFTGFVTRMLRGTDLDEEGRNETLQWWQRNLEETWADGMMAGRHGGAMVGLMQDTGERFHREVQGRGQEGDLQREGEGECGEQGRARSR